jgi:two-component system, OmpR family, phosphate regulon sensor histidine kinase PhoR
LILFIFAREHTKPIMEKNAALMSRPKNRLFWKIGSIYLLLLLIMSAALDSYAIRALRREYLAAAYSQLESLAPVALAKTPSSSNQQELQAWTLWLAHGGIRATLVAADGAVLADSEEDPKKMTNHRDRPEIRDALKTGSGQAIRSSVTVRHDLIYLAKRFVAASGEPRILRLSLPLNRLDAGIQAYRRKLWSVSLLILILTGGASLLFFRTVSNRIRRLSEFSDRVAQGDFRRMPIQQSKDELADLSNTLNQTASQLDGTIRLLTKEREQSAAILAGMEEGVVVVDASQRILFYNRAFSLAFGIPETDYKGRSIVELLQHSDMISLFQSTLRKKEIIHGEIVIGSVQTRSFAATAAPIQSEGAAAGAVMVLHDITEIRRLERARRDFVANISHEFRTPLTAIQGFAETLLDGALEDETNSRRFLLIIHDHALRLSRLTEDLLKLARIEAGQLTLEIQPVAINTIFDSCIETGRIKAAPKNLALATELPSNPPLFYCDVRSLQEILQNLLDNAIRYTPDGGRIRLRAAVHGSEIELSISDTGIGIPKADQQRIFERFYRTDAARSRESGGTGLGLSIAKHLVEAHGGRIQVASEVGQGSVFSVFFPLGSATQ